MPTGIWGFGGSNNDRNRLSMAAWGRQVLYMDRLERAVTLITFFLEFPLAVSRYVVPGTSGHAFPLQVFPGVLFQGKSLIHSIIMGVNSRKVLGFRPLFFEVRVRAMGKSHS